MDSTGIDGWTGVHLTRQRSAVMYHMYIAYTRLLPTAMTYFIRYSRAFATKTSRHMHYSCIALLYLL